jgi:hypothetical protein
LRAAAHDDHGADRDGNEGNEDRSCCPQFHGRTS